MLPRPQISTLFPYTTLFRSQFRAFYDDFAGQKSLLLCDMTWLRAACESGRLVLTSAGNGGEPLVWHAYLKCGPVARLTGGARSEEHTSELQSQSNLVCRLLL